MIHGIHGGHKNQDIEDKRKHHIKDFRHTLELSVIISNESGCFFRERSEQGRNMVITQKGKPVKAFTHGGITNKQDENAKCSDQNSSDQLQHQLATGTSEK